MLYPHVATSPSPTDARHLVFENFEIAGIRVTERRFAAKDRIFSPVGPDEKIGTRLTLTLYGLTATSGIKDGKNSGETI
jgi:hypothetical protein